MTGRAMNTGTKLAAFAVVLAVAFGAAAAVGSAVGPIDIGPHTTDTTHSTHDQHGEMVP